MSLLLNTYPLIDSKAHPDVISIQEFFLEKSRNIFLKHGELVFYDGTPLEVKLEYPLGLMSFFSVGMNGIVSETSISDITRDVSSCNVGGINCIVYSINRDFDAFGKLNILCDEKNIPEYVYLITDGGSIFSERFEGKKFIEKEPIFMRALRYANVRLVLEYKQIPEKFPDIRCDVWTICEYTQYDLQTNCYYSSEHKFYYSKGRATCKPERYEKIPLSEVKQHIVSSFMVSSFVVETLATRIPVDYGCMISNISVKDDEKCEYTCFGDRIVSNDFIDLYKSWCSYTPGAYIQILSPSSSFSSPRKLSYRVDRIEPEYFESIKGKIIE